MNYQQQQEQPLIQNIAVLNMRPAEGSKLPVKIICPNCKQEGMTNTVLERGSGGNTCALIFCLIGCLPCCLISLCVDNCKDVKQYCKFCNAFMGQHEYKVC